MSLLRAALVDRDERLQKNKRRLRQAQMQIQVHRPYEKAVQWSRS